MHTKTESIILALCLSSTSVVADPLVSSWTTIESGSYARIYTTTATEASKTAVTTWSRGRGTQSQPVYAGVTEVNSSADWVYIKTSGLGHHVMGPWYLNEGKTQLFPNYPANSDTTYRFTRNPSIPDSKSLTGLGAIGFMVDGIALFDGRDGFSYSNSNGQDGNPMNGIRGDGVWVRDAYVNEGVTFDAAGAHQAGPEHHYHANPPALRHSLGDHVDYDEATNTYIENPTDLHHSPILGWVRDGIPIYGPYGYADALDPTSEMRRMISGYQARDGSMETDNLATTGRNLLPAWAARTQGRTTAVASNFVGPTVSTAYPIGHYMEDYEYLGDLGFIQGTDFDLNEQNVRFCVTPEYPDRTWAYFVSIEADGTPKFPYNIGRTYFGTPSSSAVNSITETVTTEFSLLDGHVPTNKAITQDRDSDELVITWSTLQGGHYEIQTSTDMQSWTGNGEFVAASNELDGVFDTSTANKQFFRINFTGELEDNDSE
jgi:hypothetical protein